MGCTYLVFLGATANPPSVLLFLGGFAFDIDVVLQLDWHMHDLETGHQVILVGLMVCEH
jgi:hypothetical protein